MVPVPISLEMTICELVVVEAGTKRVSKINSFTNLTVSHFPFEPGRFFVFAVLTGSQGKGELMLTVTHAPTGQAVYGALEEIEFLDRFHEAYALFEPFPFAYPLPGVYIFTLEVDGDWISHRRIHIY